MAVQCQPAKWQHTAALQCSPQTCRRNSTLVSVVSLLGLPDACVRGLPRRAAASTALVPAEQLPRVQPPRRR
eukprot:6489321-Amphidinium_carterae.2